MFCIVHVYNFFSILPLFLMSFFFLCLCCVKIGKKDKKKQIVTRISMFVFFFCVCNLSLAMCITKKEISDLTKTKAKATLFVCIMGNHMISNTDWNYEKLVATSIGDCSTFVWRLINSEVELCYLDKMQMMSKRWKQTIRKDNSAWNNLCWLLFRFLFFWYLHTEWPAERKFYSKSSF